jgi:hypothetical protein
MISHCLDDDISRLCKDKRLVWMPAHQGANAIKRLDKSDGTTIKAVEWRANRLADALAKIEAKKGAAPQQVVELVTSAESLVRHEAALLGTCTYAANNCWRSETLDSRKIKWTKFRDSVDQPRTKTAKKAKQPKAEKPLDEKDDPVPDWNSDEEQKAYPEMRGSTKQRKTARRRMQRKKQLQQEASQLKEAVGGKTQKRPERDAEWIAAASAELIGAANSSHMTGDEPTQDRSKKRPRTSVEATILESQSEQEKSSAIDWACRVDRSRPIREKATKSSKNISKDIMRMLC